MGEPIDNPILRSLAPYVPSRLQLWKPDEGSRNFQQDNGTLCLVDISGFTNLSERLARLGRIGAEELTDHLNAVFSEMLELAYRRRGTLLKFGGDALLLAFGGDDHPSQACSAAVEMNAALRASAQRPTSAGRLGLRMSVGVHSGPIDLFRVGTSHHELIVTGPAASAVAGLEHAAAPGEILVGATTRAALPAGSATAKRGPGWKLRWRKPRGDVPGPITRVALDEGIIAQCLPTALRAYLQEASTEAEHRLATIGFIRFSGIDEMLAAKGGASVADALDQLVTKVQGAADAEGVTFLASDVDEDGGKIILVSGVPTTQDDDEGRMLCALKTISDEPNPLPLSIGVNTGHVFAGEVGMQFRKTYTVMGDPVNLAARLMTAAPPGAVYASPAVLDRSGTLYATTALKPFSVKGKAASVQAYQVGDETGSRKREALYELPFVGRGPEITQLREAWSKARSGRGTVLQVIGATGIGKSRLVAEALSTETAKARLGIRAEPYSSSTPYRPFRDELRRMLGVEAGSPHKMAEQLRSAARKLDPALTPLLPLLGDVTQIDTDVTPEVADIEPRFRRDRVADVMVRTLELVSPGPLLIVAEDSHWMDEASVHLLHRLENEAESHGWLLVATRRLDAGGFAPSGKEMVLEPLSEEESSQLVLAATESAPLRPHDIDSIVSKAGGNPLFLEEIVSAVRQAGGADTLPESIDGIVNAQIDALAPVPHQLLRFASVLGRSFRVDLLEALLEGEDIALDAARQDELSRFLEEDGEGRWRFRHALIRDVAYEGLPFRRRRDLHQRAGIAMERLAGRDTDAAADQLALHFSLAEDQERAWRYGVIAGDRARALYANVEASENYERALRAARGLAEVADHAEAEVWTRLGDAREDAGLFDASLDAYRKASQLVADDPILRAQALYKRARARERSGAYSLALRELTTAERLLDDGGSPGALYVRAQLSATRAQVHQAQEKPHEALRVATQAVAEAEASGNQEALASAYVRLDWAHIFLGRPDEAAYGNKALAIFRELGDLGAQAIVIGTAGIAAYFDGDWDEAIQLYEAGRDAFQRAGNAVHAAHAESNIGEVLVNQERFDEAEMLLRDAIRVLQASGFIDGAAFGEIQLGRALTGLGRLDEAEVVLQQAWEKARELGITGMAADAATFLAECRLEGGDAADALRLLDKSALKEGGDFVWQGAVVGRVRAAVLAQLGRKNEASKALEAGLVDASQHGLAYERGLLLRLKSQIDGPDPASEREAAALLDGLGVVRHHPAPV
jgi:class 3 adenylate cyclase/tetratricopeptide (TPR) repeat protein